VWTIATVHNLDDVAQGGRYVAWAVDPGAQMPSCGHTAVVIEDLHTGRRVRVPARPLRTDCSGGFWGLTLAGSRAYAFMTTKWDNGPDNGPESATLFTASLADRKARALGAAETAPVPLAAVSDGAGVYSWLTVGANGGPIVRFQGLRKRRLGGSMAPPAALAAGGGRFAWAAFAGPSDDASSPAWSPDGKEIAYTRHQQLWVVNADGTDPHQIVASGINPDWSPDGTKLAYYQPGGKVMVANADGSDPQVITTTGAQIPTDPAWSPNGSELAVDEAGNVLIVSVGGPKSKHFVLHDASEPDWSPDGSQLAYNTADHDRLMVANADGSDPRSLAPYGSDPAWSPDGSEIAYTGGSNYANVFEIRPDGTGRQALPTGASSLDDFSDPAWGPNPGQLVFTETDSQTDGDSHLVTWPGERQITGEPETITVSRDTGRAVAHIHPGGPLMALAVSRRVVAALVREPNRSWAVEIYQPRRRTIPLRTTPQETGWRWALPPSTSFSAAGTTLVFEIGHTIETLNAVHGSPHPVATTKGQLDLSIFGRRIVWADRGRIRTLNLPR
jgi:TolB protein